MSEAYATAHTCSSGSSGSVAVGAHPHPRAGLAVALLLGDARRVADVADVDRPRPDVPAAHLVGVRLHPRLQRLEPLRAGHVGHGHRVLQALLLDLERRRQVEDRLAVLHGDDAAGGEAAAVADAVDLVHDRDARVAGAQEVRVQAVHRPVGRHGAPRRDERLAGDLPAEHPLQRLLGPPAPEDVDLDPLEVEQRDELVQGRVSRRACEAETGAQRSCTCPAGTSRVRVVRTAAAAGGRG